MDIQAMEGAKTTGQISLILEPKLKKIEKYSFL